MRAIKSARTKRITAEQNHFGDFPQLYRQSSSSSYYYYYYTHRLHLTLKENKVKLAHVYFCLCWMNLSMVWPMKCHKLNKSTKQHKAQWRCWEIEKKSKKRAIHSRSRCYFFFEPWKKRSTKIKSIPMQLELVGLSRKSLGSVSKQTNKQTNKTIEKMKERRKIVTEMN